MVVVKRYPNRKLYNTETRQYITLDELADLIRRGEEIQVIDYSSGNDMTALTMTQILFEQVKKQSGFLPMTVLTGLIQAGGDRVLALQRSLSSAFGYSRQLDDEIQSRIQTLIEQGDLTEEEGESLSAKLLALGESPTLGTPHSEDVIERVLTQLGVPTRKEFQHLLDQIDTLSAKLDELSQHTE